MERAEARVDDLDFLGLGIVDGVLTSAPSGDREVFADGLSEPSLQYAGVSFGVRVLVVFHTRAFSSISLLWPLTRCSR